MSLLQLRGVHKSYSQGGIFGAKKRVRVLSDVNLSIEPDTCMGLLGRSGSGKSTLARIALSVEQCDAGEVMFQGRNVRSLDRMKYRRMRKNVQVVFQNSPGAVNPRFTAFEIISEPLQNFENLSRMELRRRVGNLLERVGLSADDASKYPHQFSGGELQRVCIARAVAPSPRLLILDEAVSSLDMLHQTLILDLLAELRREANTAYLFISHDIRILLKVADCFALMHDGSIIGSADPMDGSSAVTHPVFQDLVSAILPPIPEVSGYCRRADKGILCEYDSASLVNRNGA